jgi:hypothetical protein
VQTKTVNVPTVYLYKYIQVLGRAMVRTMLHKFQLCRLYTKVTRYTQDQNKLNNRPQQTKISIDLDINEKNKTLKSTGKAMYYITKDKTVILKFLSP